MSQERTHDSHGNYLIAQSYSAWHRRHSTRRFIGIEEAQKLAMIDLDAAVYIEYDDGTKEPLFLIETAQDIGQGEGGIPDKPSTVVRNMARQSKNDLSAFVVLYTLSKERRNPADPTCWDIESFRCKRVWPLPVTPYRRFTPEAWCRQLIVIRRKQAEKLDLILDEETVPVG